jgi:ketosteroid isomerase-like protein
MAILRTRGRADPTALGQAARTRRRVATAALDDRRQPPRPRDFAFASMGKRHSACERAALLHLVRSGRLRGACADARISREAALSFDRRPERARAREILATGVMSRRVETIRRAHEALNSGDVEGLVAVCDPSFRLDMSDRVLNPAVYEGHEGIRQFVAEVHEAWETFTWEPEELLECGDLVLALIHSTGRGRGSGLELDRHAAMLWTVPANLAVSLRFFRDRAAARRAAGR